MQFWDNIKDVKGRGVKGSVLEYQRPIKEIEWSES